MNNLNFSISANPIMITSQELETFQTYAHDHLVSKAKRIISFLKSEEFAPTATEICQSTYEYGYNGVVVGIPATSIGGALGAYANYHLKSSVMDGLVKGAVVAVTITMMKNSLDFSIELKDSLSRAPSYSEWLEKAKMREAFPIYQKILINTPELKGYICPLSQDWIQDPVMSPDGIIYERSFISAWSRQKDIEFDEAWGRGESREKLEEIRSTYNPFRGVFFREKDLVSVTRNYETVKQDAKKYISTLEDGQVKLLFNEAIFYLEKSYTENQEKQKILVHISEKIVEFVKKMDLPQSVSDSALNQLKRRAQIIKV